MRLKYARFYAFLLFKEPPSQARRSDACGLAFLFGTKFPTQSATRCSCGYLCAKFPQRSTPCSRVSFLIPAPTRAHLKPALRIVGGEATDLAVAAGESSKAVKKRRRQTLCLRSIRFRLCDSRLRQRCGAWLLRHFCHQKWQRTLRNFVAHKNKSGWCQPPTVNRLRVRGAREERQEG